MRSSRAAVISGLLAIAALALWQGPRCQPQSRPRPPCIVPMSIDTLRADRLGCYGHTRPTSPNIDAFASESVQFLRAFSQAPSTAASHMSLFTGVLPPLHRATNTVAPDLSDLQPLIPGIATQAERLHARGYLTVGFHGGANVAPEFGFGRGFDRYDNGAIHWSRVWRNDRSLRPIRAWLERSRRESRPLSIFLHHHLCHDPYVCAPPPLAGRLLQRPVKGLPRSREEVPPRRAPGETMRQRFWRGAGGGNPEQRRHILSLYDAGVARADFVFGRVRRVLEEEGAYQGALFVLLSDHGEEFWEHGDTLHWRLFRETLHVPLSVKLPGRAMAGRKISVPVRQFAIMPTLLEYAGIPRPTPLQAVSLMPLLRGKAAVPSPIVSFSDRFGFVRIVDGDFAYSNQPSSGEKEWLFDVANDPLERRNLAPQGHPRLAMLRSAAAALLQDQEALAAACRKGGAPAAAVKAELREQLKALGCL